METCLDHFYILKNRAHSVGQIEPIKPSLIHRVSEGFINTKLILGYNYQLTNLDISGIIFYSIASSHSKPRK